MPIIDQKTIDKLTANPLKPETLAEQLAFQHQIFEFLKEHDQHLGQSRPIVTLAITTALYAFRQVSEPVREIPPGFLSSTFECITELKGGGGLTEVLETFEPNIWHFFLGVAEAGTRKEGWSNQDLAMAGLIFGTLLLACMFMFYPLEELGPLEQALRERGVTGMEE